MKILFADYFSTFHWSTDSDSEPSPEIVFDEPTDEEGILNKEKAIDTRKKVLYSTFCSPPLLNDLRVATEKLVSLASPQQWTR